MFACENASQYVGGQGLVHNGGGGVLKPRLRGLPLTPASGGGAPLNPRLGGRRPLKPPIKGAAPPLTPASEGGCPLKPLLFQEAMQSGLLCVCLRGKMHHNMWEGKDSCTMGEGGGL